MRLCRKADEFCVFQQDRRKIRVTGARPLVAESFLTPCDDYLQPVMLGRS